MYCIAQNARDKGQQKAALILYMGPSVHDIYYAFAHPNDDVDAVITKLNVCFAPFKRF
jgi:hypothetical protein